MTNQYSRIYVDHIVAETREKEKAKTYNLLNCIKTKYMQCYAECNGEFIDTLNILIDVYKPKAEKGNADTTTIEE